MKFARKSIFILSFILALIAAFYTIYYNFNTLISKYFVNLVTNSQDVQKAIENFIDTDEVNAVVLSNIAKDEKDPEKAKIMTDEALKHISEKDKFKLFYNLANTYYSNDQYKDTLIYVNKAIALNKNCHACYNLRGLVNKELNNLQASLNDFNTSLKIKEEAITYHNRHILYDRRLNLKDKAIADLKAAIKLDKSFIKPKVSLLDIYIIDKNFTEANKVFKGFKDDLNLNIAENKAVIQIFDALIHLFEHNNIFQSFVIMENTLTFLLNLKQSLLGDFEYEVIMLKSMIIIKSLIFFQENDLARKSINLAKKLEDKYSYPEFRKELLIQEQRLNASYSLR